MSMKKQDDDTRGIEGIDFSDIPEMTDEQLVQLKPSHLINPTNVPPNQEEK